MRKNFIRQFINNDFQNIIIRAVTYLMAFVSALRGLLTYSWISQILLYTLIPYFILLALEGFIKNRHKIVHIIYILIQLSLVIVLYTIAPLADYWALLLLPSCVFVIKHFNKWQGYGFIFLFCITAGIMLTLAEDIYAIEYIPIYVSAFIMVSSFSLVIRQTTESRNNAEKLSIKLENANRQLRLYSDRAADLAVMEERTALAGELHDSVTQTLFSINLLLNSLENNYDLQPESLKEEIRNISSLSQIAMKELRKMINQLHPGNKVIMNFYSELGRIIEELENNHKFFVDVDHQKQEIPYYARRDILAILREALFNSLKHSGVDKSTLVIRKTGSHLQFIVSDRGKGMKENLSPQPGHIGLENIKMKSLELGAKLKIDSKPDVGTTVTLTLPDSEIAENEV